MEWIMEDMEDNKEDIEKKTKNSNGNEVDYENQQQSVLLDPVANQVTGLITTIKCY